MRQLLKIVGIACLLASFTACIDVSTVIKVNPDGSGFIEETVLISRLVMEQFGGMVQSMAEGFGSPDQGALELPGFFDEAKLESKANQYGQGVQYVSGEEITSETGEGYRAVYHFSDINLLEIDQNPSDKMGGSPLGSLDSVPKQFMTFRFQSGITNTLVVKMLRDSNRKEISDTGGTQRSLSLDEGTPQLRPEMLAMFQSVFKDMRIAMSLDIQHKGRLS
ncbi:MAG: hypothetical protein ACWGQW_08595 [bacterium]